MLKAMRLLCAVAAFAFASFSLVDPLIVTDYSSDFVIVRVGLILCLFAVLAVSHLNVSNTAIQHLGGPRV